MRSAKRIIPKKINKLGVRWTLSFLLFSCLFLLVSSTSFSQNNSPYSRYGLGDLVPSNNIVNRSMGGISAAYKSPLTVNFNNPASYSSFLVYLEERSNKAISGRVLLDVGINFENRTLKENDNPQKFTSGNAIFSYLQVGIPLTRNWGMSFGLRPISRVDYKIGRIERLFDPVSGLPIDSSYTEFAGNGGSYLPSIGTGIALGDFSIGVNLGYLFGRKENSTRRFLLNDTVSYFSSNHTTETSYNNIFLQGGAQYKLKLNSKSNLVLGLSGNLENKLNATQDLVRETFFRDPNTGDIRIDSVFEQNDIAGTIIYPSSFTAGFVYEKPVTSDNPGLLFGIDYSQSKWSNYRFYGMKDAVQDSWEIRAGMQLIPVSKQNYFSNVEYRAGFFIGEDYLNVGAKLPVYGVSFGLGLPIPNNNPLSRGQFSRVNLGIEYNKRGNNDNLLKDDIFRISLGLNFSDIWFRKPRYE